MGYSFGHGYGHTWRQQKNSGPVIIRGVVITAPTDGAVITGTVTVTAVAIGVVLGVQFKIDGVNLGAEDTVSPFTTSWNTSSYSIGPHTITATARYAGSTVVATTVVFVSHVASSRITGTDGTAFNFTYPTDAQRVAKKVASVVTEFTPNASGIVNSSTSQKMVYDSTGTLVWVPHNILQQSENLAATWVLTNLTAPSATQIRPTAAASTVHRLTQSFTVVAGERYTYQAIVSYPVGSTYSKLGMMASGTGTAIDIIFDVNLGTIVTTNTLTGGATASIVPGPGGGQFTINASLAVNTTGFQLFINNPSQTTGSAGLVFTAVDTATGINIHRQQVCRGYVVTDYIPTTTPAKMGLAITYDPLTHVPMGLLSEATATNTIVWSTDMNNAVWSYYCLNRTPGAILAPNGRMEGMKFSYWSEPGIAGFTSIYQNTAGSITGKLSIYAKAGEISQIVMYGEAGKCNGFDLLTGTAIPTTMNGVPDIPDDNPIIENVGNGWYRCAVDAAALIDVSLGFAVNGEQNGLLPTEIPTGNGLYLWGPQLEATNTIATSYIPTFAAAVTRTVDSITIPSASTSWNTSFPNSVDVYGMSTTLTSPSYFGANDGTDNNRITVDTSSNTKNIRLGVISGAATYVDLPVAPGPPVAGVYYRASMAIAASDCAFSLEGAAVVTDTSLTLPAATTSLTIGNGRTAGGKNTYIRYLVIEPRRVINSELVTRATS